jgi:hypothetical protein
MGSKPRRFLLNGTVMLVGIGGWTIVGCLGYGHWSRTRNIDLSSAVLDAAEAKASAVSIHYGNADYRIDKRSELWPELSASLRSVLTGRGRSVSYYHPGPQAMVIVYLSPDDQPLCQIRVEDEFVQFNDLQGIVTDLDIQGLVTAHLFRRNEALPEP